LIHGRPAIYHRVQIARPEQKEGFIHTDSTSVACGVAVVVTHRQKVLFGKRKSESNTFEWQLPGGWIAPGESPQQAAEREVAEETGLKLLELYFVGITNNVFSTSNHSMSLYFEAECAEIETLNTGEGDKCAGWEWKPWNELSGELYLPLRLFTQTGYRPFMRDAIRTYVAI
jgi:ADP-ribose pyrophosphatase YjhB (NUDIX family)